MSLGEGDLYSIYPFRFTQGQSEAWSGKGNESFPPPQHTHTPTVPGFPRYPAWFKSRPWVERGGALTTQTPTSPTSIGASVTAKLRNIRHPSWLWWLMPISPALATEAGRLSQVQGQPRLSIESGSKS